MYSNERLKKKTHTHTHRRVMAIACECALNSPNANSDWLQRPTGQKWGNNKVPPSPSQLFIATSHPHTDSPCTHHWTFNWLTTNPHTGQTNSPVQCSKRENDDKNTHSNNNRHTSTLLEHTSCNEGTFKRHWRKKIPKIIFYLSPKQNQKSHPSQSLSVIYRH